MVDIIIFSLILLFFLILIFIIFWKFYFLRNPERIIPKGNTIVSPADGKIIKILRLKDIGKINLKKGIIGKIKTLISDTCKDGYLLTIMMNLHNVHVQRSPVEGVVLSINYSPGKFKSAVHGDRFVHGLENEKNEIIIQNNKLGKIKVIQIAGILARRIECFVAKNQKLIKGQRIGRINLGSQVALIIPTKLSLSVNEGDKVRGGETIIAKY